MATDWRDALANLNLPAGDDAPQAAEQATPHERALKATSLKVAVERKGRGGKVATIIYGFPDDWTDERIEVLASRLKQMLGTGGSARGGEILIQGNCREKVLAALAKVL